MNQATVFKSLTSVALVFVSLSISTGSARAAEADVNPQLPNVLLLVDTSGSMEYKTSSNSFPVCRYDTNGVVPSPPAASEKSRWIDLVEVLTGSISNYDCQKLDRGSASFKNEYKVNSTLTNSPYDFLYANPYHRATSNGCVVGPGTWSSGTPATFPSNSFNYHTYNNTGSSCAFTQAPDGILDSFKDIARFGLMTFDTDPNQNQGELGTYSYVVGAAHQGKPTGCTTFSDMEVGARNASAPPWEGRLIPFGDPNDAANDYVNKNDQIQQVLRATRPYGATPIAGMMADARDFLWNDTSYDLVNTTQRFGPSLDPYRACRKQKIILLSDGQPNMDLRGHCSGSDCPFQKPEDIAADLLNASGRPQTKTYVVGFALNTLTVGASTVDCSALTSADLDSTPSALCTANPDNPALQACCNLARIAFAGDKAPGQKAYFANDREQLRRAISFILSQDGQATSRTQVAYSGVSGTTANASSAQADAYRFYSGFTPSTVSGAWVGNVRRERWKCDDTTKVPSAQTLASDKGDFFADNLNSQSGRARTFYTVQGTNSGGIQSENSIRPGLNGIDVDGAGAYSGSVVTASKDTLAANVAPESMTLTGNPCTQTVNGVTTSLNAAACRDRYIKWLVGDSTVQYSRCPTSTDCNLFGDVFHSTPRVVNAPRELTKDNSYDNFTRAYATRPVMLYTSTNDGFLHAFKVASNLKTDTELVDGLKNNELWAFIPPKALPHIPASYPFTHQLLLDGVAVVKDVVARKVGTTYTFERTVADAAAGATTGTWRTILVQGFGGTYPGYFALDITNPDPTMTLNGEAGGPKFLWQLTTDASGTPLFGSGGATPIITTLIFDEDGTGAKEVPVAVLPGGSAGAGTAGSDPTPGCVRATSPSELAKFTSYPPRSRVPCYTTDKGGRSLTIVRLDTGKIVRTFRRAANELPAALQPRVTVAPLDSPITGEPVAYPSDVGSVAERIFVGDQDGTLWKVDVSNKTPSSWTMSLFWDAYPAVSIHSQPAPLWNSGQPIATPPVLSVDLNGYLTLAVSTGSQGVAGAAPGMQNFVWSLKDLPDSSKVFFASVNWLQQFLDGERVTGPMSLFESNLYFSTVTPPPISAACVTTNGARIWGMHYITPRDGEGTPATPPDRTVGGLAAKVLSDNFNVTTQYVADTDLLGTGADKQAVIFGVSVAQVPTCYQTDTVSDPYFGSSSTISNVNPGKFQLLMQTGTASKGTGGKAEASTTVPGVISVTLPTMAAPSKVEGWAAIVE